MRKTKWSTLCVVMGGSSRQKAVHLTILIVERVFVRMQTTDAMDKQMEKIRYKALTHRMFLVHVNSGVTHIVFFESNVFGLQSPVCVC
jgi:predicted nucleic acid-binding OB-fold protein